MSLSHLTIVLCCGVFHSTPCACVQVGLVVSQEQRGLPIHKLKVDVVTQWSSAYDMVETTLT